MPCKHPLIRAENRAGNKIQALDGHYYYPAKIIKAYKEEGIEHYDYSQILGSGVWNYQIIPCGKCIGCRLDYSREWANRGYLESRLYKHNYFVTLTYDDEHLKKIRDEICANEFYATIEPNDMKKFMHDLRQKMQRKNIQASDIRYMGCGEYGDEGLRPHMHIILFNCNLPTETFYKPKLKNGNFYYQNTIIEECWTKGLSNISEATWNTIAYTARYITKKIKGKEAKAIYNSFGIEQEFLRTSRNKGIGYPYYEQYWKEIYDKDKITIHNLNGTIETTPPKYFDDLYKKDHPKEFEKIKEKRRERAKDIQRLRDSQTSLTRQEQLEIEEATLHEKTLQLLRPIEKKKLLRNYYTKKATI